MTRRQWLVRVGVPLGGSAGLLTCGPALFGAQKKGRRPDNKKSDSNRDGKNTVNGAIWQLTANLDKSGKQVQFTYRATDLVLYDVKSGKTIGGTKSTGKNRAHVTFYEASPLPGQFDIRLLRFGPWKGEMSDKAGSWAIRLDCLDR